MRDIRRYTAGVQPIINTDKGVDHLRKGTPFANVISGDTIRRNPDVFTRDLNLNTELRGSCTAIPLLQRRINLY